MKVRESIVPGWSREGEEYVYPPALEGTAFEPWGFDQRCDSALDMLDWAGFDCLAETDAPGKMRVRVTFASAGHSHTNHTSYAPPDCPVSADGGAAQALPAADGL